MPVVIDDRITRVTMFGLDHVLDDLAALARARLWNHNRPVRIRISTTTSAITANPLTP